jgi:hypothetical protein
MMEIRKIHPRACAVLTFFAFFVANGDIWEAMGGCRGSKVE